MSDLEPVDYFNKLKDEVISINSSSIKSAMLSLLEEMDKAKRVGQSKYLRSLHFKWESYMRELDLSETEFTRYVDRDIINSYMDSVSAKDRRNIKLIELNRFERNIPIQCIEKIELAKSLNIFDEFIVLFTDYSNTHKPSKSEVEKINRNRDPIVFGIFKKKNDELDLNHNRWYFITDWIDEYCDLTFDRMIDQMTKDSLGQSGLLKKDMDLIQMKSLYRSLNEDIIDIIEKPSIWNRLKFKGLIAICSALKVI